MKKVNTELGISADASEDSAVGEIQKLKNRNAELERSNTALTNSNRTLLEATVNADLDAAGITDEEERKTWKGELIKNREGALPLLASVVKNRGNQAANTLTNRRDNKMPGANGDGKDKGADEKPFSQQIDELVNSELAKIPGNVPNRHEKAFENAQRAKPELFKPQSAPTE